MIRFAKLVVLLSTMPGLTACGVIQMSARLACSDNLGQSMAVEARTPANCAEPPTVGRAVRAPATTQGHRTTTQEVTQVYLPSGGYQITRSGSTVFVNQTSRGR